MHLPKEVKIGIIALLVLLLTFWGFNFLKGKNILKPTDNYFIVFNRIDGIIESGNVTLQGYKIGNITSIYFDHDNSRKFIVEFVLEDRVKIPINSKIVPKQQNPLAATSDLELILSNETSYYKSGDTIPSVEKKGIADILGNYQLKFDGIIGGLDSLLNSVNNILNPETEENLRSAIANLEQSLTALNQSMSANGNLQRSLNNLEGITSNLHSKDAEIASILTHFNHIAQGIDSADLQTTLLRLDTTLAAAQSIFAKMDQGEGSLGKLVNDSSLYTNLDSTSYYLKVLIKDLQENPKKYVHISVFGGKKK